MPRVYKSLGLSPRLLPLFLLLAACGGSGAPEGPTSRPREAASASDAVVEVLTTAVVSKPLGTDIEAIGTAMANESVEITSKVANTVKAIRFDEGTRVKRGAVLVELDDVEARADVAEAQAALTDSQSQYRRSRELVAQQALSQAELDRIESSLQANRARMAAARARLEDTVIRAGFDGRTGFRRVSVGALITPGTAVTTLDDTSIIKLSFTVPETELFVLQKGLPVTATTTGLPGRTFEGKITLLATRVDPVSRSITVRAQIANRDDSLRPGMFMTVQLSGRVMPALLIPEAALVPERGETSVFVVSHGRVERREVKTGRRRPGEVEIVSGLAQGERVVVEGTQHVSEAMQVREREYDSPAPPRGS